MMPTSMPSSRAARRAMSLASAASTWITPSRMGVEVGGDEAGADALDRVRAGLAAEMTGDSSGSTAKTFRLGQAFFSVRRRR
jgi:hypothetical protein